MFNKIRRMSSLWDISDCYQIFCIVPLSKYFHRVPKVIFTYTEQFSIENFLSELQTTLICLDSLLRLLNLA